MWLEQSSAPKTALKQTQRNALILAWEHFGPAVLGVTGACFGCETCQRFGKWLDAFPDAGTHLKKTARHNLMLAWEHFGHRQVLAARFGKSALYELAQPKHDAVREKVVGLLDTMAVDAKGKPKNVTGPLLTDMLAKAAGKPTKAETAKKAAETRKAKGEFKHSQVTALLSIPPSELTREEINALAQHLAAATA